MSAVLKQAPVNPETPFEIQPVWKQVDMGLADELITMWGRQNALHDPSIAAARARQAVCVTRDAEGRLCGVGTAVLRVLPRLRQPLYFYRQFFTPEMRGLRQAVPFLNRCREVLREYNAGLPSPESLGVLLELENPMLAAHYTRAYEPSAESVFIGYSHRGLQLRVSWFEGAQLLTPAALPRRKPSRA